METMIKVKEETKKLIDNILKEGIPAGNNLDYLGKLIDIQKDVCEIEKGSDSMDYNNYGRYSSRAYGDNYSERYGRRARDNQGRYMAHSDEILNKLDMIVSKLNKHYGDYADSRDMYGRGDYEAKEESLQSLNYMLESVVDFIAMLKRDAKSQGELDLIKRYAQTISEM
jgi:hypothetical protein